MAALRSSLCSPGTTALFGLRVLLLCVCLSGSTSEIVPKHAQFDYKDDVFNLVEKPGLRINVKGGTPNAGDPLIVWGCDPHAHEQFEVVDSEIRLLHAPDLCLNAEGGVSDGARIVAWPCKHGGTAEKHEEWDFGKDGRIRLKQHPEMCMNVKESNIALGTNIILWHCGNSSSDWNEIFVHAGTGEIRVAANRDFHFNIGGAEMKSGAELVLWNCQAHSHELFSVNSDRRIVLKHHPHLCLNGEAGLGIGHRVVVWPCHEEMPLENEQFGYDSSMKVIHSLINTDLVFNVKGGAMNAGDEIVLWPVDREEL